MCLFGTSAETVVATARRVGSAPATVRVRVPVPDIRINSKGDVVFKERADNDMPDPFASSAIELDPRSKVHSTAPIQK